MQDGDGLGHALAQAGGGLRDRGLNVTKPILAVLDGSKALAVDVDAEREPDRLRSVTEQRMRQAYHAETALQAEAELEILARELDKTHPGACGRALLDTGCAAPAGRARDADYPPCQAHQRRSHARLRQTLCGAKSPRRSGPISPA